MSHKIYLIGVLVAAAFASSEASAQGSNSAPRSGSPSAGTGTAAIPNPGELMKLIRARIVNCWTIKIGEIDPDFVPVIDFELKRDGSLSAPPKWINSAPTDRAKSAAASSAIQAVQCAAPFSDLPISQYEQWRKVRFNFDARAMLR